jgi:hypothetical protein
LTAALAAKSVGSFEPIANREVVLSAMDSGSPLRFVVLGAAVLLACAATPPRTLLAQAPGSPSEAPRGGWQDGSFFLESANGDFRMTIGGRVNARYQFDDPVAGEHLSSFFLRRVRLDLRGHMVDPRLTFRIMPELTGTASLRHAWIDYAFDPALQVRVGQTATPFQWHRFVSSTRHHFAERSTPSETFGFPGGFDVGVLVHGHNAGNTFSYGVGLFDGAGRNVRESNSAGHMASTRLTWAATGVLPREESDLAHSEAAQVTFGIGLQGANRNEVRAWDLGRSAEDNRRADWVSGLADVSVRWRGFSGVLEGYLRRVSPDDPLVTSYTGRAHTLGVGHFVVPGRLEIVGRTSVVHLDRDDPATRERHWGGGVNVYHHGHLWKTHVQYLRNDRVEGVENVVLVQLHLMF